jgi:mersacidin/lichenicidin family type 2 lantibiotic
MSTLDVIRAWKDETYRLSLSQEEQALLPAHPAGLIELTDDDLNAAAGGSTNYNSLCCSADSNCWSYESKCPPYAY